MGTPLLLTATCLEPLHDWPSKTWIVLLAETKRDHSLQHPACPTGRERRLPPAHQLRIQIAQHKRHLMQTDGERRCMGCKMIQTLNLTTRQSWEMKRMPRVALM